MTVTIDLDEQTSERLAELSETLGVRVEDLAKAGLADALSREEADFQAIVHRVIEKNRELYQRLA
jgi:predicted transcriptional regulator